MAQASRALVMLLPTPPLPDTTPITFLMLLWGLGASCCGPCRLGQSSPQLEQSWVHSSLILLFPAPKGGAASCFVKVPAGIPPRGLPSYHTTKGRPLQGGRATLSDNMEMGTASLRSPSVGIWQAWRSPASLGFPLSVPAACGCHEIDHLKHRSYPMYSIPRLFFFVKNFALAEQTAQALCADMP